MLEFTGEDSREFSDAVAAVASEGYLHLRPTSLPTPGWSVRAAGDMRWMLEGGFDGSFLQDMDAFWRMVIGELPFEPHKQGSWFFLTGASVVDHSLTFDRWRIANGTAKRIDAERPPWAAIEIGPAGLLSTPLVNVIRLGDSLSDVDVDTLEAALKITKAPLVAVDGDDFMIDPQLTGFLDELSRSATRLFSMLLDGSPELRCILAHPNEWLAGLGLGWRAVDSWTAELLPLDALSSAQRKWADVAIRLSLVSSTGPTVLIIDEPEGSVHRSAEHHLVEGLVRLAGEKQLSVIAATHSPAFLAHPAVSRIHVERSIDGFSTTKRLDMRLDDHREGLAALGAVLGLGPGDLLQMVRCFVVVEGEHDLTVLDELFGTEFGAALVRILPLRGAKNLGSLVNAQLLFDFTDAPVCLVLDHLKSSEVEPIWRDVLHATADERERVLARLDKIGHGSAKWLRELGTRASRSGTLGRIRMATLEEPDIICYLPPESLNLPGHSWYDLGEEYLSARRTAPDLDFKRWLSRHYGANTSVRKVRGAAGRLDTIPGDLVAVAHQVLELAGLGWSS